MVHEQTFVIAVTTASTCPTLTVGMYQDNTVNNSDQPTQNV